MCSTHIIGAKGSDTKTENSRFNFLFFYLIDEVLGFNDAQTENQTLHRTDTTRLETGQLQ